MAEDKDNQDYQNEAYVEVEKSRFQAFKDLFKRQNALPDGQGSKHKTTNVDMRTSMNLASLRASLVEKVGNFFEAISKIGTPKKEENLNKFDTTIISSNSQEKSTTKDLDDNLENTIDTTFKPVIPGIVDSTKTRKTVPNDTIIIAEATAEGLETEENIEEISAVEMDLDSDFETSRSTQTAQTTSAIEAVTMNVVNVGNNIIIPKTPTDKKKEPKEQDGPEL